MDYLKNNKRFSFKLDGKNIWETEFKSHTKESGNEIITEYFFEGGLKVTNVAKKYPNFGAYEWVNYFENVSDNPTGVISELWDCDCTLPIEHEEPYRFTAFFPDTKTATKIYAPSGSTWEMEEFYCNVDKLVGNRRINHIYPNETKTYAASGGRSSEEKAPFFNIHKNNAGYIMAIGWTGQWNCSISRGEDTVTLKSKIEDTEFALYKGEKFRTSSVVIMPYSGDVIDSHNKWRRLVKEHFSLIGTDGRDKFGPLCAGMWGGMKTESVLKRIDVIKENNLPFEYLWMDAGWYGEDTKATPDEFEGDWGNHTGDWTVSPFVHPNGLNYVKKAAEAAGMKFLLWFEPERVIKGTPITKEHPEYFLLLDEDNPHRILNLGNDEAWTYCFNTIAGLVEEIGIDCYRQDFNIPVLDHWRKNDEENRKGITEIKHINGMYRLWDALLERFPNLIIDNCASGGRRIDIETLRRSMPLWRSDYQCPANYDIEAAQCHHLTFNSWMPYSGTGTGRYYDEYRIRSAYDSSMTTNYTFSERNNFGEDPKEIEILKKYTDEYLKVKPYFCEDFYPLSEVSDRLDVWCAAQFHRPEENDGIIQVFRRPVSPYESACYKLRGLDKNADYLITDADGGEVTSSGKDLLDKGFNVEIKELPKAKLYFYKKI
ncbi:MAG: alpha-galactosidase [Clostridia bacterium]|nr:alpha-galactosidase [Clostridia bacterium]